MRRRTAREAGLDGSEDSAPDAPLAASKRPRQSQPGQDGAKTGNQDHSPADRGGEEERAEDDEDGVEEEEEEEEEAPVYTGPKDSTGQPHGRGTLQWPKLGNTFCGRFRHGAKSGKGLFRFSDGSYLQCTYEDDEMQGPGVYTFPTGESLHGAFVDGVPHGSISEFDQSGRLVFAGEYTHGQRARGSGVVYFEGGGWLEGRVEGNAGLVSDSNATYTYPDSRTKLVGQWKDSLMVRARPLGPSSLDSPPGLVFCRDVSSATQISTHPMQPDPYEQGLVYVAPSAMPGAGEGLFAKVGIPPNTVVAFYNGVRLTHDEVDGREWDRNSNTISLDEETVIDVPAPWDSTSHYVASLGHKANHSFVNQNAKYDYFDHPRFGQIKCVRSLNKPVLAGAEILVTYGYDLDAREAPEWYMRLWEEFQALRARK